MPPFRSGVPTHILIAEDEMSLAKLLRRWITGYDPSAVVSLYSNGRDALAAYDRSKVDLVISNHSMPHMDGPTFIRILRGRGDSIPIIGISGSPSTIHEFLAAGATVFLDASAFKTELLPLVQSLLLNIPNLS